MTEQTEKKPRMTQAAVLAVLLAGFVAYAGNFHFVYGTNLVLRKVDKVSWSLSETVINVDEVRGMPQIVARAKFPLFVQALEKGFE